MDTAPADPKRLPRYTLEELLDASDYSQPQPPEEREWVDTPAVGRESNRTGVPRRPTK